MHLSPTLTAQSHRQTLFFTNKFIVFFGGEGEEEDEEEEETLCVDGKKK